jgi:hypothetical protein
MSAPDTLHTLYLTHVDPERRAVAIRAVSRAFMAAGMPPGTALEKADECVHRFLNTHKPVGLIAPNPAQMIEDAVAAFIAARGDQHDAVHVEANLHTDEGEAAAPAFFPSPETAESMHAPGSRAAIREAFSLPAPDDYKPSPAAAKTAMMLMAMTNGNVQAAWIYAQRLAFTTGDVDFWLSVGQSFESAFGRGDE